MPDASAEAGTVRDGPSSGTMQTPSASSRRQRKTQLLKNFCDFAKIPLFNIHARVAPFLFRPAPESPRAAFIIADSDEKVQSKPFGKGAENV